MDARTTLLPLRVVLFSVLRPPRLRFCLVLLLLCCGGALIALPALAFGADGEQTPLALEPAPVQAAETAAVDGSSILRTILGLAVVIGLIYALTWVLKAVKRAREQEASGTALRALATLPLGPNRSLHLVRAGDVVVLLAVGEGGVTPIRTYHEQEARALGLIGDEDRPVAGGLGTLGGAGLPTASLSGLSTPETSASPVARMLDGLRRRTVI